MVILLIEEDFIIQPFLIFQIVFRNEEQLLRNNQNQVVIYNEDRRSFDLSPGTLINLTELGYTAELNDFIYMFLTDPFFTSFARASEQSQ